MEGWVCFHRKITQWQWYTDSNTFRLFFHLVLMANHKDQQWKDIVVKRGQVIVGRKSLALQLKLTEDQVRYSLKKLKASKNITTKSTNKYTLVTIVNYDFYQSGFNNFPNKMPDNSPTDTQQIPTNNNVTIISCYCSRIHSNIDDTIKEHLTKWLETFSEEVVLYAIEVAVLANKKSYGYIHGILKNWQDQKLYTVEAIQLEAEGRKAKPISRGFAKPKGQKVNVGYEQRTYDYTHLEAVMDSHIQKQIEQDRADEEKVEQLGVNYYGET